MEREKIRSWVNKEIDPKKEKASPLSKLPKVVPSTSVTTTPSSSSISQLPSLPSFLNFLDPSNQSDESSSSSTPQKKSPIFSRKTSSTPKPTELGVEKEGGGGGEGGMGGPILSPQPANLPSPLQPERLTVGASPSGLHQHSFSKNFFVKYLGHVEVQEGRNITVITDTIQRVVSARALRNKRDAQAIEMTVTHKSINLYDHNAKKAIGQIFLRDILRCAVQPESSKLFGIVNRTVGEGTDVSKPKFLCHVMEADTTGSKVCTAINEAIQAAVKILQSGSRHSRSRSATTEQSQARAIKSPKDQVDLSESPGGSGSSPMSLAQPSSSTSASRLTKPNMPKQKSISDSNMVSVGRQAVYNKSSQSVHIVPPSTSSSSQPSLKTPTTTIPNGGQQVSTTPQQRTPSAAVAHNSSPSFCTMPTLLEQKTHHQVKKPSIDEVSGIQSSHQSITTTTTNGSSRLSLPLNNLSTFAVSSSGSDMRSKPATVLSVAATSGSGYYQMPSSLQSGADILSDLTSPLTPIDPEVGYLSSQDPSMVSTGGKNPGPNLPLSTSTSTDSCYFQGLDISNPVGINVGLGSSGGSAPFFVGGETGSSLSSFTSGSSYLPSGVGGGNGENEGLRSSLMENNDVFGGDVLNLSSMDKASTIFSSSSSRSSTFSPPSSSFHQSSQGVQGKTFMEAEPSSDYLPSTNTYTQAQDLSQIADSIPLDSSWEGTTLATTSIANIINGNVTTSGTQSMMVTSSTNGNSGSSRVNFPVSFGDDEGGDFDDFDLPPLPDSLDPLGSSGSGPPGRPRGGNGHSGQGGYGGSIVTLGNPAN